MPAPARAALLLALAFLVPAALAEPSPEDWDEDRRTVTAWPDGGGFVLRSARDSGTGSDEIGARYDAASARLDLGLQATQPEEAVLGQAIAFQAILEFKDEDGDGRHTLGEPVVRRIEVPGTPAASSVRALPGGVWQATSVHTLPAADPGSLRNGGTAKLEDHLEARPAPEGGKEPTSLDLQLRILDAWARNGTHLAIEAAVDNAATPADVSSDVARVQDGGLSLATAWQDGQGTVLEGQDPRSLTFVRSQPASSAVAFPAALSASWQPIEGGVGDPGGDLPVYLGAAAVAAAAFAVPAWRRLRR